MTAVPETSTDSPFPNPLRGTEVRVQLPAAIALGGLLAALLAVVFFEFFRRQVMFAITQPSDWAHTLLIPAITGYFIWLRRKELAALQPFAPCWFGLLPIMLGVGWYLLCVFGPKPLFHHNIMSVGILLTLIGIAWVLFGTKALRWFWFPLGFLWVFGQTLSEVMLNKITFQLQDIAAVGAYFLLTIIGMEVDRSGNTLVVWSGGESFPLNVAEACSGMRMLVAFAALGVFLAATSLTRFWQRALLVSAALPIALAVNIVRVASLGVLSQFNRNFIDGEVHEFIGVLWLIPGLFLYMGALWLIQRLMVDEGPKVAHAV
jgi:exosortase